MGYQRVFFFEEGYRSGGIGEHFGAGLMERRYFGVYEIHAIETFLPTCTASSGLRRSGLDVDSIRDTVLRFADAGVYGSGEAVRPGEKEAADG